MQNRSMHSLARQTNKHYMRQGHTKLSATPAHWHGGGVIGPAASVKRFQGRHNHKHVYKIAEGPPKPRLRAEGTSEQPDVREVRAGIPKPSSQEHTCI
jgi:hypothetical protein